MSTRVRLARYQQLTDQSLLDADDFLKFIARHHAQQTDPAPRDAAMAASASRVKSTAGNGTAKKRDPLGAELRAAKSRLASSTAS